MKPRDQGGVVDARLNVYGVEGLKVAGMYQCKIDPPPLEHFLIGGLLDLSICPSNVGNVGFTLSCRTILVDLEVADYSLFSLEHVFHCVIGRGEGGIHYWGRSWL